MEQQQRQTQGDAWTTIDICTACGTAQFRDDLQTIQSFYCLACGHDEYRSVRPGTWLHAYTTLRLYREAPYTAAMLLLRMKQRGTPIMQKDAVKLAHAGTRWRVVQAEREIADLYHSVVRIRSSALKEEAGTYESTDPHR